MHPEGGRNIQSCVTYSRYVSSSLPQHKIHTFHSFEKGTFIFDKFVMKKIKKNHTQPIQDMLILMSNRPKGTICIEDNDRIVASGLRLILLKPSVSSNHSV